MEEMMDLIADVVATKGVIEILSRKLIGRSLGSNSTGLRPHKT
jgi:hypothetical protein